MEKLRQRHRAEKQRASSFPGGQFFSSWFYFEAMEAMENGPSSETVNNNSSNLEINNATHVSDHQSLNPGRSNQEEDNEDGYLDDSTINETPIHPGYKNHKSSPFTGGIRIKPSNPSHQEPTHQRTTRKFSKVVHKHEVDEDGEVWVKVPRNKKFVSGEPSKRKQLESKFESGKKNREWRDIGGGFFD
ncbi:unnamed protein product [Lactuca saligna]|uniref:Uncharacterized protein n=1 Tax=Lactuca saligna TaxID=75948 RepID=A0AA36A2J7_LACSI|nr:unnamed protein product [Lactuca saligna]